MKKKLFTGLSVLMAAMMLTACGSKPAAEQPPAEEKPVVEEPAAGAAKTGLGIITTIGQSKDAAADAEGTVEVYSMVAAVIVDADGKIANVAVDGMQTKVGFNNQGAIMAPLETVFQSKMALGDLYGMKKNSAIGKEWNEQAQAFVDYAKGKTLEELKATALNEEGRPTGDDLKASVTVHVDDIIAVIEKAVMNAQELGAESTDKLGLSMETTIANSKNASATEEGMVEAYTNYAAVTFGANDVVTSSVIDASQTKVNFDATGKITTDLATVPMTKVELGDEYGMKKNSEIGKEWYEQIKAFSDYVVGKTVADIKGLALDEEGRLTGDDIKGSVSIHVNDQVKLIEMAQATAK